MSICSRSPFPYTSNNNRVTAIIPPFHGSLGKWRSFTLNRGSFHLAFEICQNWNEVVISMAFQIYKNLARLNEIQTAEAEALFLECSGSIEWAKRMAALRPFKMLEELFLSSERNWNSLSTAERLEAFSVAGRRSFDQGTVTKSAQKPLNKAERLYHDKFGFIFVVDTSGRSLDELEAICKARLGNSIETELAIATNEHLKIIETRLTELLEK